MFKLNFFNNISIQKKLPAMMIFFGVIPALGVFLTFEVLKPQIEAQFKQPMEATAVQVMDVVDRNVFERYGDVQSFTTNTAAADPHNWHNPSNTNPLIKAMNAYTTNYGMYKLMILVSPEGQVLAVNTMNAKGEAIKTDGVYQQSFADAPWLKKALKGEFLEGRNGFTGSVVEQPSKQEVVGKVYGDDGMSLIFSAPIKDDAGHIIAVWANFAGFEFVEAIMGQFYDALIKKGLQHPELTLINDAGTVLVDYDVSGQKDMTYHRNFDVVGNLNLVTAGLGLAKGAVKGGTGQSTELNPRKQISEAGGYAHSVGAYDFSGLGWSALVRAPEGEVMVSSDAITNRMMEVSLVLLVLVSIASVCAGIFTARPIRRITETMGRLAGGETCLDIPYTHQGDEMGGMARTLEVFKKNAEDIQRLSEVDKQRAQEQAHKVKQEMLALSEVLDREVQTAVGKFNEQAQTLRKSAENMRDIAAQVSDQAGGAVHATEGATTNVQGVSAASEELSASVHEISNQVSQSTTIVQEAVISVDRTTQMMRTLSEAAGRIGQVIDLISDIANQINLLALNATIEAARAGETGKGFAVVAGEVKNLTLQTSKATEEISSQIKGVQQATEEAVKAIEEVTSTIRKVDEISAVIAAAVEEQGAATNEISRNAQQAADGTREATERVQSVVANFEQTTMMSNEMHTISTSMAKDSDDLLISLRRVLRDSVAGDRRQHARCEPKDMTGHVTVGGKNVPLKVLDLSTHGVAFAPYEGFHAGQPITFGLSGLNENIQGKVGEITAERVRVLFAPSAGLEKQLTELIMRSQKKSLAS